MLYQLETGNERDDKILCHEHAQGLEPDERFRRMSDDEEARWRTSCDEEDVTSCEGCAVLLTTFEEVVGEKVVFPRWPG